MKDYIRDLKEKGPCEHYNKLTVEKEMIEAK